MGNHRREWFLQFFGGPGTRRRGVAVPRIPHGHRYRAHRLPRPARASPSAWASVPYSLWSWLERGADRRRHAIRYSARAASLNTLGLIVEGASGSLSVPVVPARNARLDVNRADRVPAHDPGTWDFSARLVLASR